MEITASDLPIFLFNPLPGTPSLPGVNRFSARVKRCGAGVNGVAVSTRNDLMAADQALADGLTQNAAKAAVKPQA